MKRIATSAAVAAAVSAGPAQAHENRPGVVERVAGKQCSQKRVVPCVRRAALHWRVDGGMLLRKARCESTLNPYARNGVHVGLFQFNFPGTWGTTPYRRMSPWRAKTNALAAAWMHSRGRGGEWSCR